MVDTIGLQLRDLRKKSGLTLAELSRQTGLSIAFISNVERNLCSPTLDNLQRICSSLNISLIKLFENQSTESKAIRKSQRDVIFEQKNLIRYEAINFGPSRMDGLVITVEPHCQYEKKWTHAYDEIGLVLEGELTIHFSDSEFVLYKGDAFYIDAMTEHSLSNHSEKPCSSYWVKQGPGSEKHDDTDFHSVQKKKRQRKGSPPL